MSRAPLGDITVEEFLEQYWQKKPVLIRQAFPGFESPLEPDELAGLACQEGVLSRLILEQGGDYPWQLRQGPFDGDDFDALGDSRWTVLVQEVDRHVPAVADLFDEFDFLPSWRKDDVMISFAARDAGVGAHTDSYDVFLLQGSGRRRWEIGPVGDYTMKPDLEIRMIDNFEPTETFELEPGDMLYLPPGVPHNGVALEPCLTYSFGFLAPDLAGMLEEYAPWVQQQRGPVRYGDPDLETGPSGLISARDVERLAELVRQLPTEPEQLVAWFGGFITRAQRMPAEVEEFEGELEDFLADFEAFGLWRRHEGVRVAGWCGETPRLFVDGEVCSQELSAELVSAVSEQRVWSYQDASQDSELLNLLFQFTRRGWGYFPEPEEDE